MSEYSIYPKAIDGYAQIPLAVDKKSPINAESVNRLRSGIINIEKAIGIAPGFSEEFGSFPDLSSRLKNLESQISAEVSLTGLYQKDPVLRLDEEPLTFSALGGTYLDIGNFDENFIISSSTGLELETKGMIFGPEMSGFPDIWPKSVIINKSETAIIDMEVGGPPAHLTSYLSLGGPPNESDLAILKIEPPEGVPPEWGNMLGIFAGINAAMDESVGPTSLNISVLDSKMPGAGGGNVEISAGGSQHEADRAGNIYLSSGRHPLKESSNININGPEGGPFGGGIRLSAGGLIDGSVTGAHLDIRGSEELQGGGISILAGYGESFGGSAEIRAGDAQQGGDIYISSGYSNDLANISNIFLQPGGNDNGDIGSVYINGHLSLQDANLNGDLGVGGNVGVNHNLSVGQTLFVGGNTSLQGVHIGGNATMQDVFINGMSQLQDVGIGQNLFVAQHLNVNGTTQVQALIANNTTLFNDQVIAATDVNIGQDLGVGQDFHVGGDTTLNNIAVTNVATFNGNSITFSGLGAPRKGDMLVARDTLGEVGWMSQAQYVSGVAVNPGSFGGSNIRQVIFTDPTSGLSTNAGCWIVPADITIEKIFIKWVGENAPGIGAGEILTWDLGILTSNTGTANTTLGVNFSPSGEDLSALSVDNSDDGDYFYKSATLDYVVEEGDILVLKHELAGGSWTETTQDVTVTIKYYQRYN